MLSHNEIELRQRKMTSASKTKYDLSTALPLCTTHEASITVFTLNGAVPAPPVESETIDGHSLP